MGRGDSRESKRGKVQTGKNISEATDANFKCQEKRFFFSWHFLGRDTKIQQKALKKAQSVRRQDSKDMRCFPNRILLYSALYILGV